jgi:hypothetical protein
MRYDVCVCRGFAVVLKDCIVIPFQLHSVLYIKLHSMFHSASYYLHFAEMKSCAQGSVRFKTQVSSCSVLGCEGIQ